MQGSDPRVGHTVTGWRPGVVVASWQETKVLNILLKEVVQVVCPRFELRTGQAICWQLLRLDQFQMKGHFGCRWFESLNSLSGGPWILDLPLPTTTILGLGLPVDSHLLQGNPGRLLGDGDDGAGSDLHCSVELPAGKLTSGRESI